MSHTFRRSTFPQHVACAYAYSEALEPKFCELEDLYGNHAAGEGGEYETLTLDSPLFSHSLVIDEARVGKRVDPA